MRVCFPLLAANDAAETFPIWRNRDFHFPSGDRLRLFRDDGARDSGFGLGYGWADLKPIIQP